MKDEEARIEREAQAERDRVAAEKKQLEEVQQSVLLCLLCCFAADLVCALDLNSIAANWQSVLHPCLRLTPR